MLRKLLIQKLKPLQLAIAAFGTLFGFLMLILSLQIYLLFSEMLTNQKDVLGNQYMVIQKKITLLNTFSLSSSTFSIEEINEIAQLKGVKNTASFRSNAFQANAFIEKGSNELFPQLYTDLFFESIPDDFIDVKNDNWNWPGPDSSLPLILPKDYLNLYNFGFAPGQNLPQISEKTIEMLRFNVRIRGKGKQKIVNAFIAGFSNRINSILVPEKFLEYANGEFGEKEILAPSRLILATNDPTQEQLLEYFKKNGIETNEDALKSGKLNSLLTIMVSVLTLIGGIIIVLAVMNIIQYTQLLITQSDYEIRTLILIGYHPSSILYHYAKLISYLIFTIGVTGIGILYFLNAKFIDFFSSKGYELNRDIHFLVYLSGIGILFFVCLVSFLIIGKQIQKISLENSGKKK